MRNYNIIFSLLLCVCVFVAPVDAASKKSRYGPGNIDFLVIPAENCSVIWYDAEIGDHIVSTANPYTTYLHTTTTYYAVSVSDAGCESATRTAVTRTINLLVASYGLSNKAAWDPIIKLASTAKTFTLWGRVASPMDAESFYIDDGSGKPVQVNHADHGFEAGDYISTTGMIDYSGNSPIMNAVTAKKLK